MNVPSKAILSSAVALFAAWTLSAAAATPDDPAAHAGKIPKHLALARELLEHIKPEDNRYSLGEQRVGFPGDLFSSGYSLRADCSGFLLAMFDRAKYSTSSRMAFLPTGAGRQRRLRAEDFVFSIENEKGFKRIDLVRDIQPGDVLAHAMLKMEDKSQTGTTGHVMLIDGYPRKIEPRAPIVDGTEQFETMIIDSNREWLGSDDTRLADPDHKIEGLGRGTIRLYADADGKLVGWARTFKSAHRFFSYDARFPSDTKERKAAIGRPVAGN